MTNLPRRILLISDDERDYTLIETLLREIEESFALMWATLQNKEWKDRLDNSVAVCLLVSGPDFPDSPEQIEISDQAARSNSPVILLGTQDKGVTEGGGRDTGGKGTSVPLNVTDVLDKQHLDASLLRHVIVRALEGQKAKPTLNGSADDQGDVSELDRIEREVERLTRLYAALSHINKAIVRTSSRQELLQKVCRILVEKGGFCMVWIGWHDAGTQRIRPIASWGDTHHYLRDIEIFGDDRPAGRGPTGTAFREGRPYICNDFGKDSATLLWREAAWENNCAASADYPLRLEGKPVGTLTVYANTPEAFQDKEVRLLEEIAGDVSFALDAFAREEQRQQMERDLRERVKELQMFYHLSEMFAKQGITLEEIYQNIANLAPPAWQYPEITCARVVVEDTEFLTTNFQESTWKQVAPVEVNGEVVGCIEVFYLEEKPNEDEGPFLKEERLLIDAVADILGVVTERKRNEHQIQESQTMLSAIVDSTDDMVWAVDAEEFRIFFTNRAHCEFAAKELGIANPYGKSPHEMVPDPQRRELWLAMFRRTLSDGAFRVEHKFKSSTRTLLLSFQPLKHDDETFGISVFGKDITENLATQERLRQLSQAVEQSPASVIITDMEEKIVYVNPKFCELTGYAAQEVYGLKPRELVGRNMPEESYQQLLNALNSGKEWHGESYSRKKNGELYWESLAIAPITNEMGEITHFASVSEDITPRKGMEEALRRSHEELEIRVEERTAELAETNKQLQNAKEEADKANLAKSEFLSRMSHELRTPLNAILGFGQLLQSGNLAPGQQESVDFILKGGRHLLDLINEVLDIARIEAGRMQLSLEPVSVGDIVSETVDLVRPLSRSTGVELRELVTGTAPEHLFVKADSQRLKQVLLNLMSNALKYNRDGGSVSVACEAVGDHHLRILVRDTGPGIAPEKMERLFIPFERLGAEHSRIEGTGLGLAISKRLIEAMEGRMGVASIVGEGSTFSVELAVVSSPLTSAAPRADSVPVTPAALREHTILYIEDNLSNLHLMEEILRERPGATLISAMQGNEGLKLALNHLPDLILLDLHLPELSGYEVLLSLRAEPTTQRIPVVVVSADATPGQIARMLSAGAYGYLTKPLDIRKFLEVLDKALGDPKER